KEFDKKAWYDVGGVAFSPDGKALGVAVAGLKSRDVVRLYDARTGRELQRFSGKVAEGVPRWPVFSPDGRWLAVAYNRKEQVEVWDVATGELIRGVRWNAQAGDVIGVALSPDGKTLFVCYAKDGVRLYETANWGLRRVIDRPTRAILVCP